VGPWFFGFSICVVLPDIETTSLASLFFSRSLLEQLRRSVHVFPVIFIWLLRVSLLFKLCVSCQPWMNEWMHEWMHEWMNERGCTFLSSYCKVILYIGTATNEMKDDSPFRHTLATGEPTLPSGLSFDGQRR